MKQFIKISLFFGLVVATLISGVRAEEANAEDNYMIFIEHDYKEKSDEYKKFINGLLNEIHNLIVNNKSTYKHPEVLDKKEKEFNENKDKYLMDYGDSPFVYPISSIGQSTVLLAYLTPELVEKVKTMKNVVDVERDKKIKIDDPIEESVPVTSVNSQVTTSHTYTNTASTSSQTLSADAVSSADARNKNVLGTVIRKMML